MCVEELQDKFSRVQEPMYIILNTAISHRWGMPEPCDHEHCSACWICYDCMNPGTVLYFLLTGIFAGGFKVKDPYCMVYSMYDCTLCIRVPVHPPGHSQELCEPSGHDEDRLHSPVPRQERPTAFTRLRHRTIPNGYIYSRTCRYLAYCNRMMTRTF